MTRDEIADNVRENLADAGITYYQAVDITDAIQDAYDDIVVFSGCIQKKADVNFTNNLNYYHMLTAISDFFAVVAIRNNNTNRWMDCDSIRGFDNIRWDWELWEGQPLFYAPTNFLYIAMCPRMPNATGNFTVWYRATANTLSGSDVPLVHADQHNMLEWYATADLLEQAQEYIKADGYWTKYFKNLISYKARIGKLAESDYIPVLESSAV